MTVGSWTVGGGANDAFAGSKSWSGADGALVLEYINPPLNTRWHYVRDRSTPHPYTMNNRRMTRTMTTVKTGPSTTWTGWNFGTSCVAGSPPVWSANDDLKLLAKLASKIKGHNFQAGIMLAEGRKAVNTVRYAAEAVLNGALLVKKGKFAAAARSFMNITGHKPTPEALRQFDRSLKVGDVAGVWLSLQYAWKPLLNDVYEGCKALERIRNDGPGRSLSFKASHSIYGNVDLAASPTLYKMPSVYKRTVRLKYILTEAPSEQSTWGLYDPMAIAWELLPFSFVVDWFIPVSTFLEDMQLFRTLSGSWVRSDFQRVTSEGFELPGLYPIIVRGSYKESSVQFTRTVGSGRLAVPNPDLKALEKALSKDHLKNAAALITVFTTKLRSSFKYDPVKPVVLPRKVPWTTGVVF